MHVGHLVKEVRTTRTKYSARELSSLVGKSTSYISKLENGRLDPTISVFARIAKVLGLSAQEIAVAVLATDLEDGEDE